MALEGNLTAFGLSEILQLIAVQQKTGMLTVTNVDTTTVMFFSNGELISTRDRRRKARDAFKDYITRYGVIERNDLVRISHLSSQSKIDFIDVLTSEGYMESDELQHHWRKQMQETMHDVLTWEEGTYKFVSGRELIDGIRSPGSFSVEGMLMESMRRIDEFPQMLEMFPSEGIVFTRREGEAPADELTGNEKAILAILDSPVVLRDLIARAKMPVFEVYESLKALREKDLVDMEEPETQETEPEDDAADTGRSRRAMKNVAPFFGAFILFCGALYIGAGDTVTAMTSQRIDDLTATAAAARPMARHESARARVEYQLRWMIEAYRAEQGAYPSGLSAITRVGLATPAFMETVREHEFRYRLTAGRTGYTLL